MDRNKNKIICDGLAYIFILNIPFINLFKQCYSVYKIDGLSLPIPIDCWNKSLCDLKYDIIKQVFKKIQFSQFHNVYNFYIYIKYRLLF